MKNWPIKVKKIAVLKPYSNTICDSIMNVVNITRDETVAVIYIVLTTK